MGTVYSLGCGDRFGRQGAAQLRAYMEAAKLGIDVIPVWNKSDREHRTVHTQPDSVRTEADHAVQAAGWNKPYFVDADHISLGNADAFIEASDFFTLDVADSIGTAAERADIDAFVSDAQRFVGEIELPGMDGSLQVTADDLRSIAAKYLFAVQEAGRIHRRIAEQKAGPFHVEVSMDETDVPQTPVELLFILAMIAREQIPADTIAPKFSGRFNKGVDYVGDTALFEKEFEEDVAALRFASGAFGLKDTLRLSVHSGSDKFSLYPVINRVLRRQHAGLHVKTAGTTWLEEMIGLAEAGGDGLAMAKEIYVCALDRYDELTAPYAAVIDIDPAGLPSGETVNGWSSEQFTAALRHDPDCRDYDPGFRQLIHVAYKVAYEMADGYFRMLEEHAGIIGKNVTYNLLHRHMVPLFGKA